MNPNYPPSTAALFGVSTTSTPSASSSTVDSMSPHARGSNPPPPQFGLVPEPLPAAFLPSYYVDRRTPEILPSYATARGADSGDAIHGFSANFLTSPYPNMSARLPQVDDMSLNPLPRSMSNFHSPGPPPDLGRTWLPQGRSPWPELGWPQLSGGGAPRPGSDGGDDGRLAPPLSGLQADSPLSLPSSLNRSGQNPPLGEYDYPKSATYPVSLYADVAGDVQSWGQPTGADCGQALSIYEHLFSSLPQLRPIPSGSTSESPPSLQPLLDLSAEGLAIFTQQGPSYADSSNPTTHPLTPTVPAPVKRAGKDKTNTKCLGCGATETPEWRRGPLGPRTLCNACGLVHMKLQRKRKKQDEKLAAAKAAAEGSQVAAPPSAKTKKVKRDSEG